MFRDNRKLNALKTQFSIPLLACAALVAFINVSRCDAQNMDWEYRQDFKEATLLMDEKNYEEALGIWEQLLQSDQGNANLNYKIGYSYLMAQRDKTKSLDYLRFAYDNRTDKYAGFNVSDYDPYDPLERNPPKEVEYYLGKAFLLNYKLDEAEKMFRIASENLGNKHILKKDCDRYIETTLNAKKYVANPLKEYNIVNLGEGINTVYNDFSPVISVDENSLFFTSRRLRPDSSNGSILAEDGLYFEDIYVTYRGTDGKWQTPELLNINRRDGHLATINVSPDGQQLFVYDGSAGDGTLLETVLVGETWSSPMKLGSDINSKYWETHSALSADGNTMYFVSDRPGGIGGRDIFRVVRLPNGEWSKALGLGLVVNSKYDEDAPFIHPDGRSLYFSSKGHDSMGGFDIFYTRLDDDGKWSEPVNLGYPINTVDDDVFYVTSSDSRRAYFSSDREGGLGGKDIYMIELPQPVDQNNLALLKGVVLAGDLGAPENTIIYITDHATQETKSYKPRNRDGVFVAILPPCNDFDVDYTVNGKSVHQETITVGCNESYREINREILLDSLLLGTPLIAEGSSESTTFTIDGVQQVKTTSDSITITSTSLEDVTVITTSSAGSAYFDKFFKYNQTKIDVIDAARFELFIDEVVEMIRVNGNVALEIEASASRVPTRTWGNNDVLSNRRANDNKQKLLDAVRAKGVDPDQIKLSSIEAVVQGPRYKGDFDTNRTEYEKYQYVKITVK